MTQYKHPVIYITNMGYFLLLHFYICKVPLQENEHWNVYFSNLFNATDALW